MRRDIGVDLVSTLNATIARLTGELEIARAQSDLRLTSAIDKVSGLFGRTSVSEREGAVKGGRERINTR